MCFYASLNLQWIFDYFFSRVENRSAASSLTKQATTQVATIKMFLKNSDPKKKLHSRHWVALNQFFYIMILQDLFEMSASEHLGLLVLNSKRYCHKS